ncbi:MAG TPA: DUF429 domain-containing protein, partial [Spirochaetia bacterium]|nr:DUF429 domain-containing protein [Spirochaetia bacterium]
EMLLLDPVPAVAAIDIPIGLTETGPRECDQRARRLLGRPRSSSVFPAPVRPMLKAATYARACSIGRRADGRRINRETWNIVPKIAEVDAFLGAHREMRRRFHEAHPEVSFWKLNSCSAMAYGKKTRQGRAERRAIVASRFARYDAVRETLPRGGWAEDDLLDAFAVLWTAKRVARGAAAAAPSDAPADRLGLPMKIVY